MSDENYHDNAKTFVKSQIKFLEMINLPKKFFYYAMPLICAAMILLTGCAENSAANSSTVTAEKISVTEAKTLNAIKISVNGQTFTATLEDNPTTSAFVDSLPLEVDMQELNGNEKYFYLDKNLPSDSVSVKQIHTGDLMLFGSNCVVIFYKDFATSYSYTRLGKIDNANDLEKFLGTGNVRVTFAK